MSKEAAAFLANKELVLDNPMKGYTIPYAYLLTLLEEFAKSQVVKQIYVTNGKYGQRYYKADTKEQREKACLSILKENYEMNYYWDRSLEVAEDIIKSNNGREAVRFVFDRCDHEYEGICTETLE